MKIQSKFKIEKATSDDASRLSLQTVYFEDQKAIATNGKILAMVPCEHSDIENKHLVYGDDLNTIRKAQGNKVEFLEASLNGEIKATGKNGETYAFLKADLQYPNYKQVLPNFTEKTTYKMSFDIKLLMALSEALGAMSDRNNRVTLEASDDLSPIKVTTSNEGALGVIMPVRVS